MHDDACFHDGHLGPMLDDASTAATPTSTSSL